MNLPPKFPLKVLQFFCTEHRIEELEGDLFEEFQENVETKGLTRARFVYTWTVIRSFRWYLFDGKSRTRTWMIFDHIKMTFRAIKKSPGYTSLHILGMAMAMACSLSIALFLIDEQNKDTFIHDHTLVHRFLAKDVVGGSGKFLPQIHPNIQSVLKDKLGDQLPFVARVSSGLTTLISPENPSELIEEDIISTDPDFFKIFSYQLVLGEIDETFSGYKEQQMRPVIITERFAKKHFKGKDPLGKIIKQPTPPQFADEINKRSNWYIIKGIVQDPPKNASFQFDLIQPIEVKIGPKKHHSFSSPYAFHVPTYVKTAPFVKSEDIINQLTPLLKTYTDKHEVVDSQYQLEPLVEAYYNTNVFDKLINPSDAKVINTFIVIAALIIILAAANYINLSTVKAIQRHHEVGIRKIIGATRNNLIGRFLIESILFCTVAGFCAIFLVELTLPIFESLMTRKISFQYLQSLEFWLSFGGFILVMGIVSGIYPAISLARHRIFDNQTSDKRGFLRKSLIILQFSLSSSLIMGALIIQDQLDFITDQTSTFKGENIIVLEGWFFKEDQKFREALIKIPGVKNVSIASHAPGESINFFDRIKDLPPIALQFIDEDFFEVLNLNIAAGRNFKAFKRDGSQYDIIINENLASLLPTDDIWSYDIRTKGVDENQSIVGVIEDFHSESLKNNISPTIFLQVQRTGVQARRILIRAETQNLSKIIKAAEEVWMDIKPAKLFKYSFLDEKLAQLYTTEQRLAGVFNIFTVLAVIISAIGLFGLATHSSKVRLKEMSIRKVLGASFGQLAVLLTRPIIGLLILSFVIIMPFIFYFGNAWLEGFTYQKGLDWQIFAKALLLTLVVALITVASQVLKASLNNPSEVLRKE